jgi:hypothetical protein
MKIIAAVQSLDHWLRLKGIKDFRQDSGGMYNRRRDEANGGMGGAWRGGTKARPEGERREAQGARQIFRASMNRL